MILHTIANEYEVMGISVPDYEVRTVEMQGSYVEMMSVGGSTQVRRLISTNPALYLHPQFQPSSKTKLRTGEA